MKKYFVSYNNVEGFGESIIEMNKEIDKTNIEEMIEHIQKKIQEENNFSGKVIILYFKEIKWQN